MSSRHQAAKQRVYRERAQPAERKRLGLLEKHKVSRQSKRLTTKGPIERAG